MGRLEPGQPLKAVRPFCTPHHSISDAGLLGGGNPPQPGQISMAHKGVNVLDEMPEFNRKTLEVVRQPMEEAKVTISRAVIRFPNIKLAIRLSFEEARLNGERIGR